MNEIKMPVSLAKQFNIAFQKKNIKEIVLLNRAWWKLVRETNKGEAKS